MDKSLLAFLGNQKLIESGWFGNIKLEKHEPLFSFLSVLPSMTENMLYDISLIREPRCDKS